MADGSGDPAWQSEFAPFGRAYGQTVSADQRVDIALGLPGQWHDAETALAQNWHRDYDPSLGRYLQADPIGLAGGQSLYGYAEQDPVNRIDPEGLNPAIIGGIGWGYRAYRAARAAQAARAATAAAGGAGAAAAAKNVYDMFEDDFYTGFKDGICSPPVPLALRPLTLDDRGSGPPPSRPEDDPDCEREWEEAIRTCEGLVGAVGGYQDYRGLRGGYSSVDECAKGHVSYRCGGNPTW